MTREERRALTVFALSFTPLMAYLIAPQFVAGLWWNIGLFIEGWL